MLEGEESRGGGMNIGDGIAIYDREASKGLTEKVTFKLRLELRKGALWGSIRSITIPD